MIHNSSAPARLLAIGFCGGMGAGKTTLARLLAEHINADFISFGSYIRHEAVLRGGIDEREYLQNLGQELYHGLGAQQLVEHTLIWSNPQSEHHVFDGVRHVDVWETIKKSYKQAHLISLSLSAEEQELRLQGRGEEKVTLTTWAAHSVEHDLPTLSSLADFSIQSTDTVESSLLKILGYLETQPQIASSGGKIETGSSVAAMQM